MIVIGVPSDLTPVGVMTWIMHCFFGGAALGLVIKLVVEARRMLRLGGS